ncbi:unnamed protein product [Heterobilharzia americana]|nr:unnamed protein product [Heterobilharzia americana]
MVSSSVSVGIPSGYTIHSNNSSNCIINNSKVENNGVDEVEGKEKLEMKPRVSVDSVNRNDGKEVPVTVPAATTDTVSLSTPEKDKAPVTDLLSGFATEDNDDKCSTHHPKIHKSHGHSTATNLNSASEYDGESSTEISTSIPVSTPSATSTTGTINTTGSGGGVSSTGNFGRVKTESSLETTNTSHPGSGNSNRSNSSNAGSGNKETAKDTHRHRSGRTLRSHTAAQREKEEKERHTDDNTPIKKRKLRSRSDASSHDSNTNSHSRSGGGGVSGTGNANSSPVTTHSGSTPPSNVLSSTNAVVNMEVSEDTLILPVVTASQIDTSLVDEEKRPVVISQAMMSDEENDVHMPCVSEGEQKSSISSTNMEVDVKIEGCGLPTSVSTLSMELPASMDVVPPTVSVASSSTTAVSVEKLGRRGEAELDVDYLLCPAGPGDEDRKNIELLKFQNPYAKAAELNKSLRELVNNLVKVHPKAPCGYQDYLLVTRNYLLANQPSLATYVKRVPPPNLEPAFVELFNEQEEERYAQALKHQSEREHLQLGADKLFYVLKRVVP